MLRGTGILNNELYVGRLVWNRLTYVKDPNTGRRRSRRNAEAQIVTRDVPELRIIDDALWQSVKIRQSDIRESEGVSRALKTRFWEKRRAKHLLTGLVFCGCCGSRLASIGQDYLACSAARGRGTCSNRSSIRRSTLEELVLQALKQRLMAPELVKEFVTAVNDETNRQRREETAGRAIKEQELQRVNRKIASLIDAIRRACADPICRAGWMSLLSGETPSRTNSRRRRPHLSGCTQTWARSTAARWRSLVRLFVIL